MTTTSAAVGITERLQQAVSASRVATPAAAGGGAASTTSLESGDTEDRFLKLLVAQMRNQDPLNPLDNAQVTTQLAQINTVRGIERLNDLVAKLVEGAGAASPLEAIGAIGREVLVAGNTIDPATVRDGVARIGLDVAAGAEQARIEVVDPAGAVVFAKQFGPVGPGASMVEATGLDAKAAAGYRIRVAALSGGQPVAATPMTAARVIGVSQGENGVRVELSGRPGIAAGEIKAIL